MPADRLLETLLRSLQTHADQQDTPRLLGTASSLLATLNNPLNVTLLTSQLLSAPAIWTRPEGLRTCMQTLSVFHSAAQAVLRYEAADDGQTSDEDLARLRLEHTLLKDDWIKAVLSGADEHSPRWRHLLVIGGLLLGFGPFEEENISRNTRVLLEKALVTATNLALKRARSNGEFGQDTITLVLNHCFPILSNYQRTEIDYDALLPVLVRSALHSHEGLRSGYFIAAPELDVRPLPGSRLEWPEQSTSFQQIRKMLQNPLISSLGPLSRLVGHAIESVHDASLVIAAMDELEAFARTLHSQWKQQRLSHVEPADQRLLLGDQAFATTMPALFRLLQSAMFASVIILRSVMARSLGDAELAGHKVAPDVAEQTLNILRALYFITTRQGSATFSQYNFVYYTALDVLSAYTRQVEYFLLNIKPSTLGRIPDHPIERNLDLFFLNTAEHFTLSLSSRISKELLIPAVTSYLSAGEDKNLVPAFEAAHSVTLALFSAPQNTDVTVESLPLYVDLLLQAFPTKVSARQFRLAFKALLTITSPPSPIAELQPLLPAILLDLLHERARHAATTPVTPPPGSADAALEHPVALSEQAVCILAILDTFTQIPVHLLDEWLPLMADLLADLRQVDLREHCKDHFWHMLVGGDMDPERSRLCHAWWSSAGGKEWVLYGHRAEEGLMSGALPDESTSKL